MIGLYSFIKPYSIFGRMVDNLDEMIIETSDLSLFCFYSKLFEDNFQMCLEFPAQVCAECPGAVPRRVTANQSLWPVLCKTVTK